MKATELYKRLVAALADGDTDEADAVVEARDYVAAEQRDGDSLVIEADKALVRAADVLSGVVDTFADRRGEPEWWHNLWTIIEGEYPLDQLPEHVRDLAEKLYYD
ncbi:MAG: hypothetical protein GF399_06430 [Candidatus Coatesbacteria bacterium]|nr:hypothetical protein [Candidatus Coatesbacteria bacterium]